MAINAMEDDSNTPADTTTELPERKRKHKSQDPSTKKKRKHESSEKKPKSSKSKDKTKGSSSKPGKTPDSPYTLTTTTLYLPLSPISISPTHALASLLAEHLSPLLLTYYPPLKGIVLAYSNASISSTPPDVSSEASDASSANPNPQPLTLAASAGEYGVLYVYLTATFLVFRPVKGQVLEGWVNVQSEGFLGAVVLNLFSVGIERRRLPGSWKWIPPGEEDTSTSNTTTANIKTEEDSDASEKRTAFDPEKEHFNPVSLASDANPLSEIDIADPNATTTGEDDADAAEGYFQSTSGHRVRGTVRFRVLDIDVIPGTDRERGFMSIEGSMLSPEEEERVLEEERNGILSTATPRRASSVPVSGGGPVPVHVMSGGLTSAEGEGETEREGEGIAAGTPSKPKKKEDKSKTEDKKKKKSKKIKDEK